MNKKELVEKGYDEIADLYNQRRINKKEVNYQYFDGLMQYFPKSGRLLDIGCGGGIPVCSFFEEKGFEIYGIDISEKMIELAQKQFPKGVFQVGDMAKMSYSSDFFDLITATYSIINIPQSEQPNLLKKVYDILKPNGVVYLVLGDNDQQELKRNWHGVDMYWSYFGPENYKKILVEIGFKTIWEELLNQPNGETFYNVIVEK